MNPPSNVLFCLQFNTNIVNNNFTKPQIESGLYQDMVSISIRLIKNESPGHPLQSCDLVHETYLRMLTMKDSNWQNRSHFKNTCAKIMYRILIDHSRHNNSEKHGGLYQHVTLSDLNVELAINPGNSELRDTLEQLKRVNTTLFDIVHLRFFSGFSINDTAYKLKLSPATIKRKWRVARLWLINELNSPE